jgi:GNAT superfamily N-acetyltransferase
MERRAGAFDMRLAQPGDEAEVAALIAAFRDSFDEREPPDEEIDRVVAELIGDQQTEFLLAGRPAVGRAQLRFRLSVWTGREDAWLEDVFVVARARGRGIGRALVEASVARARLRRCARIQLDTNEANGAALALYESLGFRTAKRDGGGGGRDLYLTRWL